MVPLVPETTLFVAGVRVEHVVDRKLDGVEAATDRTAIVEARLQRTTSFAIRV